MQKKRQTKKNQKHQCRNLFKYKYYLSSNCMEEIYYNVSGDTTFGKMLNEVIDSNLTFNQFILEKQKKVDNPINPENYHSDVRAIQADIDKEQEKLDKKLHLLEEQYPSAELVKKYINIMTECITIDYAIKLLEENATKTSNDLSAETEKSSSFLKNKGLTENTNNQEYLNQNAPRIELQGMLYSLQDNIVNKEKKLYDHRLLLDRTKKELNEYAERVNLVDNLIESRKHLFESKKHVANHSRVTTNKFEGKENENILEKFIDALNKVKINRDMADLAKRYERLVAKHFRENTSSSDMFELESQMKAAITQEPKHRTRLKKIRNTMRNRTNRAYHYVVGRNETSKWHSPKTPARFTNKVRGLLKRVLPKRLNVFSHIKPYYLFGKRNTVRTNNLAGTNENAMAKKNKYNTYRKQPRYARVESAHV